MGIAVLGMIGPFNKMVPSHICMVRQQFFFVHSEDRWPPNSPDSNVLDYCLWNELGKMIKWNRITSKKSLIVR